MRDVQILDISVVDTVDRGAATNIWLRPYRRKTDKWMVYINDDRQCSVGISENIYWEKLDSNQRNMLQLWLNFLVENETVPFTGSFQTHLEEKIHLALGIDLYMTETCCVGGQKVAANGCYLVRYGKLFRA